MTAGKRFIVYWIFSFDFMFLTGYDLVRASLEDFSLPAYFSSFTKIMKDGSEDKLTKTTHKQLLFSATFRWIIIVLYHLLVQTISWGFWCGKLFIYKVAWSLFSLITNHTICLGLIWVFGR